MDVRADGGFIVAPPSVIDGEQYRTNELLEPEPLPGWLDRLLRPPRPAPAPANATHASGSGTDYGLAALQDEVHRVRAAAVGTRNHTLNQAAFNIGQLISGGQLEAISATAELIDAGMAAGLPEREVVMTARSGLDAGQKDPRRPQS